MTGLEGRSGELFLTIGFQPLHALDFFTISELFVRPDCPNADGQIVGQYFIKPDSMFFTECAD